MSSSNKLLCILFYASLLLQTTLGEIICEELSKELCAFSISSSGKRCLLENLETKEGILEYVCTTSDVIVMRMAEHIETDVCVNSCGVDRTMVGISSDSLLEPRFTTKLCSPYCYHNCPNIIDLYFNLAAGEGVYLPDLCEKQKTKPNRAMQVLMNYVHIRVVSSNYEIEEDASSPSSEIDDIEAYAPAPSDTSEETQEDVSSSPLSERTENEDDAPAPSGASTETEEDASAPSSESSEYEEDVAAPSSETAENEDDAPSPSNESAEKDNVPSLLSGSDEDEEDAPAPSSEIAQDKENAPSPTPVNINDEAEDDVLAPASEGVSTDEVEEDAPAPGYS